MMDSLSPLSRGKRREVQRGALIAFSGIDSAGKSTQIELLTRRLRNHAIDPVVVWTRGGYTENVNRLKSLARALSGKKGAGSHASHSDHEYPHRASTLPNRPRRLLWLVLAMLDLIWIYGIQFRWMRRQGRTIICDRYLWDTQVDFRVNFPEESIERWLLWKILAGIAPKPDAAFFLLVPIDTSLERAAQKERRHQEEPGILLLRLHEYEKLAQASGWPMLDGQYSPESLAREICAQINVLLCLSPAFGLDEVQDAPAADVLG